MTTPLPDASRDAISKWLGRIFIETRGATRSSKQATLAQADAVLALVEKYVVRAVHEATETPMREDDLIGNANRASRWEQHTSEIVSRVMGDKP